MSELFASSAFGGLEPRADTFGSLTVTEDMKMSLASFSLRKDSSAAAPLGLDLHGPGRCAQTAGYISFWTAPGQWMFGTAASDGGALASALKAASPDCSVTEQTDGFVVLEIASSGGEGALHALLEKLVNTDLRTFGPGSAVRTGLAHMNVFALRLSKERVLILGMRSMAGSLWQEIETAARRLVSVSSKAG